MHFVVAVAAIIQNENKVLCMKRSTHKEAHPGVWETLSGRVEIGEEPLECVTREIEEEAGLFVGEHIHLDPRPITSYQTTRLDDAMIVIVYRAQYFDGDIKMSQEHEAYAWLTLDEFSQHSSLNELVDAVEKALKV